MQGCRSRRVPTGGICYGCIGSAVVVSFSAHGPFVYRVLACLLFSKISRVRNCRPLFCCWWCLLFCVVGIDVCCCLIVVLCFLLLFQVVVVVVVVVVFVVVVVVVIVAALTVVCSRAFVDVGVWCCCSLFCSFSLCFLRLSSLSLLSWLLYCARLVCRVFAFLFRSAAATAARLTH